MREEPAEIVERVNFISQLFSEYETPATQQDELSRGINMKEEL